MQYQCTTVMNLLIFPPLLSSLITHSSIFAAIGDVVFDWHRRQLVIAEVLATQGRVEVKILLFFL